jgi:hypothetical protein
VLRWRPRDAIRRSSLESSQSAHVFLDTPVRFRDGEEVVDSKKFAETVFRILKSGAKSVTAHHSSKACEKQAYMSLENVLRGSGDIGALCATCWGVKQVDGSANGIRRLIPNLYRALALTI